MSIDNKIMPDVTPVEFISGPTNTIEDVSSSKNGQIYLSDDGYMYYGKDGKNPQAILSKKHDQYEDELTKAIDELCGTDGLVFELTADGQSYLWDWTQMSNVTEYHVVIPHYYNGKPVTGLKETSFTDGQFCDFVYFLDVPTDAFILSSYNLTELFKELCKKFRNLSYVVINSGTDWSKKSTFDEGGIHHVIYSEYKQSPHRYNFYIKDRFVCRDIIDATPDGNPVYVTNLCGMIYDYTSNSISFKQLHNNTDYHIILEDFFHGYIPTINTIEVDSKYAFRSGCFTAHRRNLTTFKTKSILLSEHGDSYSIPVTTAKLWQLLGCSSPTTDLSIKTLEITVSTLDDASTFLDLYSITDRYKFTTVRIDNEATSYSITQSEMFETDKKFLKLGTELDYLEIKKFPELEKGIASNSNKTYLKEIIPTVKHFKTSFETSFETSVQETGKHQNRYYLFKDFKCNTLELGGVIKQQYFDSSSPVECNSLIVDTLSVDASYIGFCFSQCTSLTVLNSIVVLNNEFIANMNTLFPNLENLTMECKLGTTETTSFQYLDFYNCEKLRNFYITDLDWYVSAIYYLEPSSGVPESAHTPLLTAYSNNPDKLLQRVNLFLNKKPIYSIRASEKQWWSIKPYTFHKQVNLNYVDLFNVTSVHKRAFFHCHNLFCVKYDLSLITFHGDAFENCSRIMKQEKTGSNFTIKYSRAYNNKDQYLNRKTVVIEKITCKNSKMLKADLMPPDDKTGHDTYDNRENLDIIISEACMSEDTSIESIEFPKQTRNIGGTAFYGCSNLTSITFETGCKLDSIGNSAFIGTKLTSITLPKALKEMRAQVLPINYNTIDNEAEAQSVKSIYVEDNISQKWECYENSSVNGFSKEVIFGSSTPQNNALAYYRIIREYVKDYTTEKGRSNAANNLLWRRINND